MYIALYAMLQAVVVDNVNLNAYLALPKLLLLWFCTTVYVNLDVDFDKLIQALFHQYYNWDSSGGLSCPCRYGK